MPRFDKICVTQFARTGCEKQLRIALHPATARYRAERRALNLAHPQIRPGFAKICNAGTEWGYSKIHDLSAAFGAARLLGGARTPTAGAASPGLCFASSELLSHLRAGVSAGDFLVETEFDADTETFRTTHALNGLTTNGVARPLTFARVRPDLIEVLDPADGSAPTYCVTPAGDLQPVAASDTRLQLRLIEVKLSREAGPHYFSELAYYAITLAAWLQEHGLDTTYSVSGDPAVWPGSENDSGLQKAMAGGADSPALYAALHEDFETAPLRIFLADLSRLLHDVLPRVLVTPFPELLWAVTPGCQGCENLGQKFKPEPGTDPSDWDPRHCLPTAETTQDLSRLPFVSRGAVRVLRDRGHADVSAVAALPDCDSTFDAHHRLRGQRSVVPARARALMGAAAGPLASPTATTTAIPAFAKLRLFLTADFDPGSAITLVFGLRWSWLDQATHLSSVPSPRVHYVPGKTAADEWRVFALLLDDLDALLNEARDHDRAYTQVYVWDTLTLDHLTRVVGRHLGNIAATGRLARLGWLFPPDKAFDAPHLKASPPISVVRDAVTSLLSLDVAHTYTLLETARCYHDQDHPNPAFRVPMFWDDPFNDQIPSERAHQLWRGRTTPGGPALAELQDDLTKTVRVKLDALATITDRLGQDLRDRLTRRSPHINQLLHGPADLSGTSHLGLLLYAHTKLNAALDELEINRTRAWTPAEREATFISARLPRRLTGPAETAALTALGLAAQPHRAVYQLAPGSREVKAKPGEFSWAIAPENAAGLLDRTAGTVIYCTGDAELKARWSGNLRARQQKMTKVLGVTIAELDRDQCLIAVDFEEFGDAIPVRQDLLDRGHLQLNTDLIMDPVAIDVFTRKVEKTVQAIGNPPRAARDPRIPATLGITRKPRTSPPHPIEDFLWDAPATAATAVPRPTAAIKQTLQALGYTLNSSQWDAWEQALTHRLALIWGPPGTGKTATIRVILAGLAVASVGGPPLRIAVAAGTYTAVDNVLQDLSTDLAKHWPDIKLRRLRNGARSAPAWLAPEADVPGNDSAAIEATMALLAGPNTTIVAGIADQLHRLNKAARPARPPFDVIVIDEAGQLDVAHALLVLAGAAPGANVIVAGDPLQLPPIHKAEAPAGLEPLVGSIYTFFRDWHGIDHNPLLVNYRSNSQIVALGQRAGYPPELVAHNPTLRIRYTPAGAAAAAARATVPAGWPTGLPYSEALPAIADPDRPVVCLTYPEGVSGHWNQFEADTVAALIWWYAHTLADGLDGRTEPSGTPPSTTTAPLNPSELWTRAIGVVTPHRAQCARIVDRLARLFNADAKTARSIGSAVDTVERFQGQERDIIIASYAVGDPDTVAEEAEFLHDLNRFNVLATRAKAKLVVIASRELVAHISSDLQVIRSSEMLKDFVDTFCAHSSPAVLSWNDDGTERSVPVEHRWH